MTVNCQFLSKQSVLQLALQLWWMQVGGTTVLALTKPQRCTLTALHTSENSEVALQARPQL